MPFNYFCYGAALSEVELDTLTGDFHLLRTDLCMDVGQSLNPAIDIGQVLPSLHSQLYTLIPQEMAFFLRPARVPKSSSGKVQMLCKGFEWTPVCTQLLH